MEIIRGDKTPENLNLKISRIFVDGFFQWLKFFSKDKEKLSRAFSHMFNINRFYTAIENNEVIGITACVGKGERSVRLQKSEFRKHLGFIRGSYAYHMLHREFEVKTYPFEIGKDTGVIEFVAVASEHRGKGVAAAVIKQIIAETGYKDYVLEVADTNVTAMRLYKRLGFEEFQRVKAPNAKISGVNFLVYMKKDV